MKKLIFIILLLWVSPVLADDFIINPWTHEFDYFFDDGGAGITTWQKEADGTVWCCPGSDSGVSNVPGSGVSIYAKNNIVFISEDGQITVNGSIVQTTGDYLATDEVRAIDGDGLSLCDDAGIAGGNCIFLEDGGKVGIRTASPEYVLGVAGNAGFDEYLYHNGNPGTYILFSNTDEIAMYAGADRIMFANEDASPTLDFGFVWDYTFNSPAFFIGGGQGSYDGKVGIGTISPDSNSKLDVQGLGSFTGGVSSFGGGRIQNVNRITSGVTLTSDHHNVFADTDGGPFVVGLLPGIDGTYYRIANVGSSGNDVTLQGTDGEKVRASANQAIPDGAIMIVVFEPTEEWW